jgi:tRNA modification GTPase
MSRSADTICAVATPAGRGGIGVIRVSGPLCAALFQRVTDTTPIAGTIQHTRFRDAQQRTIDFGLSLYFAAPRSFTGEDVWELQTHGSPFVLDQLLTTLVAYGCRLARPGEFSERAFLNDKLDLAQAEAIADLIDSGSVIAARKALLSLQGEFSRLINELVTRITGLRVYVEAAMDFPEEEIDFLGAGHVGEQLEELRAQLGRVQDQARQGAIIKEGLHVVIAGEPNAGKSTLLNALAGSETAIVTDIPGTTRDILRQEISIAGMPVHVADTAGLRNSSDPVEQEGIRRAYAAMKNADRILLVVDVRTQQDLQDKHIWQELLADTTLASRLTLLLNKIDLAGLSPGLSVLAHITTIQLSGKTGQGLDLLRQHLLDCAGYLPQEEGGFMARRRHLEALQQAALALSRAADQLRVFKAGELVAEELRLAQDSLGEITGKVTTDDLLGKIFASFCIGK